MDKAIARQNDTVFLRFIAIVLIVNSHLDLFYPVKFLATGGAIGNTLFFVLSSFGLYLSQQKKPRDFSAWYSRRIARIYPSVWVVILMVLIPIKLSSGDLHLREILSFAGNFFYPPFWFLQALMVYYFIGWFVLNNQSKNTLLITILISVIVYAIIYILYLDLTHFSIEHLPFKLFFYFIAFMIGMYLGKINNSIRYKGSRDLIFALLSISVIYGHKWLMTKQLMENFQFIEQLFCLLLVYLLLKISRSPIIIDKLMNTSFAKYIRFISGLTLEIYIAHASVRQVFLSFQLNFPINAILFIISSVALAFFVKIISSRLSSLKTFQRIQAKTEPLALK